MFNIFKNRDKNRVNGTFISDYLCSLTLKLIGKSKIDVVQFLGEDNVHKEQRDDSGIIMIYSVLSNKCILGFSLENDRVYKINIYLNHKPVDDDIQNLKVFDISHKEEYLMYSQYDEGMKRFLIGSESRIY